MPPCSRITPPRQVLYLRRSMRNDGLTKEKCAEESADKIIWSGLCPTEGVQSTHSYTVGVASPMIFHIAAVFDTMQRFA